ncbi:2-hydroxyacid dehydrogenase [Microbacterium halophytorum]|uniref:2-hydroxyacid dehydrogenase n=1 Tax=Microbacterium halophytorum TaxID=2067568 RepID=UPI000CFC06B7|nr:2-hydroxyacid dehydrogenase [Microbacterium halophytorum]
MVRPLRIAVTDPIIAGFAEHLERTERRHSWHYAADFPSKRAATDGADVVVCSVLTPQDMPITPSARLLHASGAGIDRIDREAIPSDAAICTTGHHGPAIAEHVIMTALMLRRRALEADAQMRRGEWRTVATAPGTPFHRTLAGSTFGIVGFGEIGQAVARLAAGFGARITATRRRPEAPLPEGAAADRVYADDGLEEMLAESDVVVVTVPLTDETRGLIDSAALAVMRPDAVLVNVARGPVVDEDALFDALVSGRLAGAGIDVWWGAPDGTTPPASVARFAALGNTVLTPHFSGHAREVFEQRAADIARNIDLLDRGQPLERRVH